MTLLPLTDCCRLLGIDPKTLRLWLQSANVFWTLHPSDARLKCLTPPQLHHLADLHSRPLPNPLPIAAPTASPAQPPSTADRDLRHLLTHLQTQVATLQEQVTHLALALLRERAWRWEERLSHPQAPLPPSGTSTLVARHSPPDTGPSRLNDPTPKPAAAPSSPTRSRSRSRALPLIEYGADGRYLVICPTQGVLSLTPDSPEWFDWLSSLTAFTFQGVHGRFSTTRKVRQGQRTQSWNAYRSLHGHSCTLYLGLTSHLTLAHLEDMATTFHARLTTV
jgi:hypothetical protein